MFTTPQKGAVQRTGNTTPMISDKLTSMRDITGLKRRALYCADDLPGAILRQAEQNIGCTMRAPYQDADHECCELNLNDDQGNIDKEFAETCMSVLASLNTNAVSPSILHYLRHIDRFYREVYQIGPQSFRRFRLDTTSNELLTNAIAIMNAVHWPRARLRRRLDLLLLPDLSKNDLLQLEFQEKVRLGGFIDSLNVIAPGCSICITTRFAELLSQARWDRNVVDEPKVNNVVLIVHPVNTLRDRERQLSLTIKMAPKILRGGSSQSIARYIYLERGPFGPLTMSDDLTKDLLAAAVSMSRYAQNAVFELQHVCLPREILFEEYRLQFMAALQAANTSLVLQSNNTVVVTLNAARSSILMVLQLTLVDDCLLLSITPRGINGQIPSDTDRM